MKYLIDDHDLDAVFDVELRGEFEGEGRHRKLVGVEIIDVCAAIFNGERFVRSGKAPKLLEDIRRMYCPERRPVKYRELYDAFAEHYFAADPDYQRAVTNGRMVLPNGRDVS